LCVVFVSGNDVYVAGSIVEGIYLSGATVWKNGVEQKLNEGYRSGSARSVYVSGNDVYVVGRYNDSQDRSFAALWKNGVRQNLTDGSKNAWANSVFVVR
jgi:hypothetical protein